MRKQYRIICEILAILVLANLVLLLAQKVKVKKAKLAVKCAVRSLGET